MKPLELITLYKPSEPDNDPYYEAVSNQTTVLHNGKEYFVVSYETVGDKYRVMNKIELVSVYEIETAELCNRVVEEYNKKK